MRASNVDQVVSVVLKVLQAALRVAQHASHIVHTHLERHLLDPPIALTNRPLACVHNCQLLGLEGTDQVLGQFSRRCADLYYAPTLLRHDVHRQRLPSLWVQPRLLHDICRQLWKVCQ